MSDLPRVYDDVVMDHIKNARNYRALPDADSLAHGLNSLCGDAMSIAVATEGERIREAAFQCECCGISMASGSIMTEVIRGHTREQVLELEAAVRLAVESEGPTPDVGDVPTVVAVARAYPARRRCAMLPWSTLVAALSGRAKAQI
jgi:nitrogen fixation NifU-like protein